MQTVSAHLTPKKIPALPKMPSHEWVEVKLSNLSDRLNRLRPATVMSIDFGKSSPALKGQTMLKKGSMNFSATSLAIKLANPWQIQQPRNSDEAQSQEQVKTTATTEEYIGKSNAAS